MPGTSQPVFDEAYLARCWTEALALWDTSVTLSPPQRWAGRGRSHWSGDEPLAYIDLIERQVVVNLELLAKMGAAGSLTAVLAHEIGHHVRFPHTLGLVAALQVLERRLIPGLQQSLTNLFFDLQVNEVVGRTRAAELAAVYRGFVATSGADDVPPIFYFYLCVYEELWSLEPGTLAPAALAEKAEQHYPGHRAQARMFVQTFYALPNVHLQFVYFCCQFVRYIPDPTKLEFVIPMSRDVPQPDEDDYDGAVRGHGVGDIEDALAEARERGWIEESGVQAQPEDDPLTTIDRITRTLPGTAQVAFRQALVARHYKRLVDQYILELPASSPPPDPALPTVLEEWEWGENPRAIDWTGTVLAEGALAGVRPLKRDLAPDEPTPAAEDFPAVEIYLDTSGSMPDPAAALNVMTLAAQILAASALRRKGTVRGIVYSYGRPLVSEWMYEEETARRFLLHYAGGGTDYPFPLLRKFAEERPDAVRIVVSDGDFLGNLKGERSLEHLKYGIAQSRLFVAFLAVEEGYARKELAPVLPLAKFKLVVVRGLDQFARSAADLADALFPRPGRR